MVYWEKRFQWIIVPNDDNETFTVRVYIFDENDDLTKNYVKHNAHLCINEPLIIADVDGMFEKEDEDAA